MSLVNDMLRDLNKRTPVSSKAARVHGAINSSIESKRPKVRSRLILAGGLLVGVGIGYFYFESMGVQVVQVPLAPVPVQTIAAPPAVQDSAAPPRQPVAAAQVETNASTNVASADTPAIENRVEIRELAMQPNGFTLLIEASEATTFEVTDRSAYGLTLHVAGIDRYDRAGTTVPGMSLMLVSDGLDIGLELNAAADFLVREDVETAAFDILLTASYRSNDVTTLAAPVGIEESLPAPALTTDAANNAAPAPMFDLPAPQARFPASLGDRPARVNRELSLADLDSNRSQAAVRMVQGGQLVEAYRSLSAFLDENPSAHQSRETLATLLLAQRDFAQANIVIDQGLAQVPNFSPFKKIKARLLMQDNDPAQALALLKEVPPAVAADIEYHELLASLYQQGNYHAQAVETYQQLLRTNAQQGRWWAGLGISLEAQDKNADALSSYQAALQTKDIDGALRQYIQNRVGNLDDQ